MIIFVVWYCRDLFVFNIFLYLNLCGKNCFLKRLVGQNVRETFVFIGQFLRWVGQCPMSDRYFKHCCLCCIYKNYIAECILSIIVGLFSGNFIIFHQSFFWGIHSPSKDQAIPFQALKNQEFQLCSFEYACFTLIIC